MISINPLCSLQRCIGLQSTTADSAADATATLTCSLQLSPKSQPACLSCRITAQLPEASGCAFFASRVQLGPEGVTKVFPLGALNEFEDAALKAMLPELKEQVDKGIAFAKNPPKKE